MNLFINSPSYYTQKFGVIDEIYQLCKKISLNINVRLYTDIIDTIAITPIIAPRNVADSSEWKEVKKISLPYKMANISLQSDYEDFIETNMDKKKQMIIENILRSLYVIKVRLKDSFDYEHIIKDIRDIVAQME